MTVTAGQFAAARALASYALVAWTLVASSSGACADDAMAWLARAATAARQLSYVGTLVYQRGEYVESARLAHRYDLGEEFDKLVSLEGPVREIIRSHGEVRSYYPDGEFVRVEPRTFRNAFPALSAQQQKSLVEHYTFRKAEAGRVAGLEAQAWTFEPKDGLRFGHKFWADTATGLILKARVVDDHDAVIDQFSFTEITIGAVVDRAMVKPTWPNVPPGWKVRQGGQGDAETKETGWTVGRVPPGFVKIVDGFRRVQGKRQVAHLVYSDGLVAVSVFVEPVGGARQPGGLSTQSGFNVYSRQVDDSLVTVLGQVPALTLRQIANSVARP